MLHIPGDELLESSHVIKVYTFPSMIDWCSPLLCNVSLPISSSHSAADPSDIFSLLGRGKAEDVSWQGGSSKIDLVTCLTLFYLLVSVRNSPLPAGLQG